ncbi:uncharacterized protein [Argopecten irradians]|uniref:uncharacterized protein isoform X2 n=1 Tax=Argopecten irradians TaxID=31199 RepID=UPI003712BB8F
MIKTCPHSEGDFIGLSSLNNKISAPLSVRYEVISDRGTSHIAIERPLDEIGPWSLGISTCVAKTGTRDWSSYKMTPPVSCCLVLMLLGWIQQTCAGGTVTIRFVSYANPTHKDEQGQCCESLSSSGCGANECDPFFKICVGAPGRPGCDFGQVKTEVHDNTDTVHFGNVIRSMANPIVKSFNSWGSGIHVRVDVLDRDAGTFSGGDDLIGTINYDITGPVDQNGTLPQQTSRMIQGGAAVIVIEYSVVCDANYYGDCSEYCRPVSPRYHCSSAGQKICLSGWVGPQCDNRVSPCAKNPCRNGGSCTDVPTNDFRCTCLRGWTGKQCEAFILPQNSNTTPKPSTSMTSPSHTTLTSTSPSPTQKPVTSTSQGSMMYTTLKRMTTSTQKMGTPQGSISFATQNGSTSITPIVGIVTTQNAVISTTDEILTSSAQHSISSSQSQERTTVTAIASTDSTTDMLSTLHETTSHQNIASCQINVAANVINVTNVTQIQVSGFNQLRLNALDVIRILEEKAKAVLLRTVSVNDTVMVFEMEAIDNTSSTPSSLFPNIQNELCQIQTQTPPGSSDGRSSSNGSEESSSNTGPVIGGVLGTLVLVAICGIVAFFLYRWKKGKRSQVMDNSKDNILQSSSDVHNEIISGNMNTSLPPVSTQVI